MIGDGTHNKKRRHILQYQSKGATPIEKNVIVVDEQGNEYEATYPKRAKGLVKNGRARFVDENKICLACPPNKIVEEEKMNENINTNEIEAPVCEKYTIAYAMEMIEKILEDKEHILLALKTLVALDNEGTPCGGSADKPAMAAMEIVKCRETTNQRLIEFYSKMVDDIKKETAENKKSEPMSESDRLSRAEFLKFVQATTVATAGASKGHNPGELPDFESLWQTLYVIK